MMNAACLHPAFVSFARGLHPFILLRAGKGPAFACVSTIDAVKLMYRLLKNSPLPPVQVAPGPVDVKG